MKTYSKGFTLIELLVVIAIIALLSAVVLVSLNSARLRGKDTRVLNDTQQMRTEVESKFNGTDFSVVLKPNNATLNTANSFNLAVGSVAKQLTDDAVANGGIVFAITDASGPKKYAIYGQLVSTPTQYFCMGSDGSTNKSTSVVDTIAQLAVLPICN